MTSLRWWARGSRPTENNPLSYELTVKGQVANFHNDIRSVYIQPGGCLELTVLEGDHVHLCSSDKAKWLEVFKYWENFNEAF